MEKILNRNDGEGRQEERESHEKQMVIKEILDFTGFKARPLKVKESRAPWEYSHIEGECRFLTEPNGSVTVVIDREGDHLIYYGNTHAARHVRGGYGYGSAEYEYDKTSPDWVSPENAVFYRKFGEGKSEVVLCIKRKD